NLSRTEMKRVLPNLVPAPMFQTLFEQRIAQMQKYTALTNQYSRDHPEVRAARAALELTEAQVDETMDSIVAGLKIQVATAETEVAQLKKQIEESPRADGVSAS